VRRGLLVSVGRVSIGRGHRARDSPEVEGVLFGGRHGCCGWVVVAGRGGVRRGEGATTSRVVGRRGEVRPVHHVIGGARKGGGGGRGGEVVTRGQTR
jgi:hypothetical protein